MKCPDCNKFASYDEPEVEVNNSDIADGNVTVEGTMTLRSACCNSDLKQWDFTMEGEVEHDTSKGEHEMEVECDDATGSYRRHIYTVEATAMVKCSCGFTTDLTLKDENHASSFDELV
jgi:hypothetical protein